MELRIKIRKVDYEATIDQSIPKIQEKAREGDAIAAKLMALASMVPPALLKKMTGAMSEEKKDDVAALLINSNKELLMSLGEELAKEKGIIVEIADISMERDEE